MKWWFIIIFCTFAAVLLNSCAQPDEYDCIEFFDEDFHYRSDTTEVFEEASHTTVDTLGPRLVAAGLVDVQTINPNILVDLKYASKDNFMRTNVYGGLNRAFLQPEVAKRLGKVQDYLDNEHPGIRLLVYDAVRPRSVQQMMWDMLDSIPVGQRVKFVSNPKSGSLHNFGCAVDLTLFDDSTKQVLDMGAEYDDMRKIAYPELESHFLATGELTKEQYHNRLLLRKAMRVGGFWVIPTEWWHFNAYSRDHAKELFEIVE